MYVTKTRWPSNRVSTKTLLKERQASPLLMPPEKHATPPYTYVAVCVRELLSISHPPIYTTHHKRNSSTLFRAKISKHVHTEVSTCLYHTPVILSDMIARRAKGVLSPARYKNARNVPGWVRGGVEPSHVMPDLYFWPRAGKVQIVNGVGKKNETGEPGCRYSPSWYTLGRTS